MPIVVRKRASAMPQKMVPITESTRNCGQTTSDWQVSRRDAPLTAQEVLIIETLRLRDGPCFLHQLRRRDPRGQRDHEPGRQGGERTVIPADESEEFRSCIRSEG